MIGHYIDKCRGCDKVMGQCRCPDKHKEIRWSICDECLAIVKRERDDIIGDISKFRKVNVDTISGSTHSVWYDNSTQNGPWFAADSWNKGTKYVCDGTLYGVLMAIRADIVPDPTMRRLLNLQEDPYEA